MEQPDTWLRINPRAVWRPVHNEAVILDLDGGHYFGLNDVATRFWVLLGEELPHSEVLHRLESEFNVPRHVLETDIEQLVAELLAQGLLVEVDGPVRSAP